MNNKGFTLVELLASIVILALIISIAFTSIDAVSVGVREGQRKNIIKKIETSASNYAFDTGKTAIFVDDLIKEGYLGIADESGNIIDPVSNNRMNCYIVEMEKTSYYYTAKFIDGESYESKNKCNTAKLSEKSATINIKLLKNGSEVKKVNKWLKGNYTLKAYSNNIDIDCESNKCVWSSSSGFNQMGSIEIELPNKKLIDTRYTFQMTKYISENEVKRYTASINITIDNEAPNIYENLFNITNEYINTSKKTVTIEASDGKGSGINGYYLSINSGQACPKSTSGSYQESNVFEVNRNGTYLVCVKDAVGNISKYTNLVISHIT